MTEKEFLKVVDESPHDWDIYILKNPKVVKLLEEGQLKMKLETYLYMLGDIDMYLYKLGIK